MQARSVADRLNSSFHRNVQKNSGYFNSPNGPWELHLYSSEGVLLEVLDKGRGGEGMRPYPKIEKSGILVPIYLRQSYKLHNQQRAAHSDHL